MKLTQLIPVETSLTDWQMWRHEMLDLFYDLLAGPDLVCLFDDGQSESDQCLLLSPGHNLMSTTQAGADQGSE